ncbi:MAG: lipopolysaccharide heptosyltransferase II [bacterium]
MIGSILVVRFSSIGDIILTTPVLSALAQRFPGSSIDFVVKTEYKELVKGHPAVRQVWAFDKNTGFRGLKDLKNRLNRQGYDLVLDLHCNLRSTYLRVRTRAFMKRAYRKHTFARLLLKNFRVNLLNNAPPVCDRYFSALEDFGVSREGRAPELYLPAESRAKATAVLAEEGVEPPEVYVCLAPGASYPTKRWSAEGFGEAATSLAGTEKAVVMVGDESDLTVCSFISADLAEKGVQAINLAGRLSLAESAAVLAKASVVLSNDSGLMHIAAALNRPLVAVFGPTSRELGFYPQGKRSGTVEVHGLSCRPCTLHGDRECPEGHHDCMRMIAPDQVVKEAEKVMERES